MEGGGQGQGGVECATRCVCVCVLGGGVRGGVFSD